MHNQLGAERLHGCILFDAVPARHNDHGAQPGTSSSKSDTLTVIATSRCDHTGYLWLSLLELVHVYQPPADLERAQGLVVLVFNPNLGAGQLAEQRPTDLRRRRQNAMNEICRDPQGLQSRLDHRLQVYVWVMVNHTPTNQ